MSPSTVGQVTSSVLPVLSMSAIIWSIYSTSIYRSHIPSGSCR